MSTALKLLPSFAGAIHDFSTPIKERARGLESTAGLTTGRLARPEEGAASTSPGIVSRATVQGQSLTYA
jgi:hypothetical protein